MDVREKLQDIFRELFYDEKLVLTNDMTAGDVEEWDSLSNILLIKEIENEFGFEFTTEEIVSSKNVGDLIRLIESKAINK